jgi:hypothetical protein
MGEPSVERIGTYVWACRQLGYQHPDLTVSAAQVRDWYANDDGLDLRALDADCDALSAAAAVADDAVRRHMELSTELAGVWSGGGAGAAREFLWRHGQSAVTVRDGLRRAAEAMTALRDELWRAVDAKVGAVLDIDDRTLPQRAEWLAAAQAVTTGAGDRATASELVDQQIKPFVDNDIRSDWLAAMHRATASATAAYDAASARLDSGAVSTFDVPGELGPRWDGPDGSPASIAAAPAAAVPVATVPAAAVISSPPPAFDPPAAAPAVAPALAPLADPLPAAAAPAAAPASPMPSLGEMGGGMPSLGAGASGFGQQLADLIGGLIGSSGDAPADAQGIDPPNETDGQGDDADQEAKTEPADAGESALDEAADAPEPAAPDETDTEPKPTPEPAATPVPPPPDPALPVPPAVPEALPTEQTPCEIAADELPQVGE